MNSLIFSAWLLLTYNKLMQAQNPPESPAAHPIIYTHYLEGPFMNILAHMICGEKMNVQAILDTIQHINESEQKAKDAIVVFQEIFRHESSGRIMYALQVFEYLVKNCNINLHVAANTEEFTNCLLGLLRRLRGKFNFLERMARNTQNWIKIEAKVLYFIQLWYDTFIMYEAEFKYLVGLYKSLRQQKITFPPRQQNEKNMIAVGLESPIFDNLPALAENDKQQFEIKKKALSGLQMVHQIDEQFKLNCLESIETTSTSKILAPIYQEPVYKVNFEKVKEFIDLAQQLKCEPLKSDYACQQLVKFLQFKPIEEQSQSEEDSLMLAGLKENAQKVVAQWKLKYQHFKAFEQPENPQGQIKIL